MGAQKLDDEDIPEWLKIPAEKRAQAWIDSPPAPAPKQTLSVKRGEYPEHWYDDPGTARMIELAEQARVLKREANAARLEEFRANRPKKVDTLAGMVSLTQILTDLAERAPRKRDAKRAVEAAKLVHTRYHFAPEDVPRVLAAVLAYERPAKQKRVQRDAARAAADVPAEFSPTATITVLVKENPRRAGSGAHARLEVVMAHGGETVAKFMAAGGNPTTLHNAAERGWVRVEEKVADAPPEKKARRKK